eukprot:TRINITY_DN5444_c0_g1_i1.p1 TRINITY_DN5444_c0_g1~~TRINITY_DN5444_c0_g1_i1.p1  ORF type:complete len:194 (+),score=60.93 TRINITY_DN5444_c0_g1_i1:39-584(+)
MIRRPPRSTHCISSAASDVYKRQVCNLFRARIYKLPIIFGGLLSVHQVTNVFLHTPRLHARDEEKRDDENNESTEVEEQKKETMEREEVKKVPQVIGAMVEEKTSVRVRGLEVLSINEGSLAARSRLKKGDVITQLNGMEVRDLNGYRKAVRKVGAEQIVVMVIRNGIEIYIEIPPRHITN